MIGLIRIRCGITGFYPYKTPRGFLYKALPSLSIEWLAASSAVYPDILCGSTREPSSQSPFIGLQAPADPPLRTMALIMVILRCDVNSGHRTFHHTISVQRSRRGRICEVVQKKERYLLLLERARGARSHSPIRGP